MNFKQAFKVVFKKITGFESHTELLFYLGIIILVRKLIENGNYFTLGVLLKEVSKK